MAPSFRSPGVTIERSCGTCRGQGELRTDGVEMSLDEVLLLRRCVKGEIKRTTRRWRSVGTAPDDRARAERELDRLRSLADKLGRIVFRAVPR